MEIKGCNNWSFRATGLVLVALLGWMLNAGATANAEIYADSAHGDVTWGVNRSTATCENWPGGQCVTGSCAHCHDTFDPGICENDVNGLMLFAPHDNPTPDPQTDNFCYECHKGTGSAQVGGVTTHTYSTNFGGGTPTFTTIYDALNPATGTNPSSHNLVDVLDHAIDREYGFTSDTNPCLVCHDQHASQKNHPVTLSGKGGVLTALRRPADFNVFPINVWGDEDATSGFNERMKDYTAKYQAPYYVGGSNFEPANNGTYDGSNLPHIVNFCRVGCHIRTDVYSTERSADLREIDWSDTGDKHGKNHADATLYGYTIAPYGSETYNYVLACTDCHEPHGSTNEWLLRTCVNGKDNISVNWPGDWWEFCTACHVLTQQTTMYHQQRPEYYDPKCPVCHTHGFSSGF